MSRKIDHSVYNILNDNDISFIREIFDYQDNLFNVNDTPLPTQNLYDDLIININKTNCIKALDRKYFHNTLYADYYKSKFGIELIPNTPIFNLHFDMFSTLIKFYFALEHHKPNKIIQHKICTDILEYCLVKYKDKIHKSYDLFVIELYEKMEIKWNDELLDMEKKGKYDFISLAKEVKKYIDILTYSNLLNINYKQKKKITYKKDKKYQVARFNIYGNGKVNHHKTIYQIFKKKYNQELKVSQYEFVLDILHLICFIHKKEYTDIIKIINLFFMDYPNLIEINDDFDENYKMLMTINQYLEKGEEEQIETMLNSLIIKNIIFLEEQERN